MNKRIKQFFFSFPREIVTWKGKLAYLYEWNMYVLDTGRGKVAGKVTQLFNEFALLLLVLDKIGIVTMSTFEILFAVIIGTAIVWVSGAVYMSLQMDKVRNLVNNYRNPLFARMHKNIKNEKKNK